MSLFLTQNAPRLLLYLPAMSAPKGTRFDNLQSVDIICPVPLTDTSRPPGCSHCSLFIILLRVTADKAFVCFLF